MARPTVGVGPNTCMKMPSCCKNAWNISNLLNSGSVNGSRKKLVELAVEMQPLTINTEIEELSRVLWDVETMLELKFVLL